MLPVDFGTHAEALFCFRAIEKGLKVAVPWGLLPYDLIVDNGKNLFKIQVKRAKYIAQRNCYRASLLRNKNRENAEKYKLEDFDYIASYIPNQNCFYIIPHEILLDKKSFNIYPGDSNLYGCYYEAWELLTNYGS